ncbi:hypothetical protein ACFQI7_10515 [Paenibacillus allorhizosphaerae]|uniref:Uncharacterized protein n=1 Tax=Paenibacillus allorhizosphaerae TaxID=2849866 RepID=A0ABM8VHY3_9BACL|nr:hypothetical protein [Paenibacillus allorhizosphaerae]CAG7643275.1 hypothetical protein PAECIP111802_02984 [Paenibacillus allorhizosphaerae]
MFEQLNDRLAETREKGRLQTVWRERFGRLKEDLTAEERKQRLWEEQLAMEERDVEKLTRLSFASVLYTLLQSKEQKLAKEQQVVLEAKLKHDEASSNVLDLQSQIAVLEQKLQDVQGWELDVQEILQEKERRIREAGTGKSKELLALAERKTELQASVKELSEALSEGVSVLVYLNNALELLGSAKNWGTYDMLGGGYMSTRIKHSRIDDAMDSIRRAQNSLYRFEQELKDVRVTLHIRIDISGFLKFSDYFFDGLVSDWIVQGKIKDTLLQVGKKRSEVRSITDQLETAKRKAEGELTLTKRQYEMLIETSEDM